MYDPTFSLTKEDMFSIAKEALFEKRLFKVRDNYFNKSSLSQLDITSTYSTRPPTDLRLAKVLLRPGCLSPCPCPHLKARFVNAL